MVSGEFTAPVIKDSDLPGLLGLNALRSNRGILDLNTMTLYFAGSGDYNLLRHLPLGTQAFVMEQAPSGHLVLPIDVPGEKAPHVEDPSRLSLHARAVEQYISAQGAGANLPMPLGASHSDTAKPAVKLHHRGTRRSSRLRSARRSRRCPPVRQLSSMHIL